MDTKKVFLLRPASFLEKDNVHPRSCCVPWTLKYIQSMLTKSQCRVWFFDLKVRGNTPAEAIRLIKDCSPDYIVIQSNSLEYCSYREILKRIKEATKAKIILVGQYPSYAAVKEDEADIWIKGESEEAVAGLILNENTECSMSEDFHIVDDLNRLPFPYYDKEELRNYYYPYPVKIKKEIVWGSLLSSRGCPYECIFCTQILRESYGKRIRLRSPENILEEIKYLIGLGANVISIEDDSFTYSSRHVSAICDKMISEGIRIRWICQARVDELDFALLHKMREAGCVLIRFGIESGCGRIIEILGKARSGKNWIEKAKEVFSYAKRLGIATDAMFIIGSPTETEEEILMSINLARLLKPDMLQVCLFTPYLGSTAYNIYRDQLEGIDKNAMYHYGGPVVNLSRVDSRRLSGLGKRFYRSVVFRPNFLISHFLNYAPYYIFNFNKASKMINIQNFLHSDYV